MDTGPRLGTLLSAVTHILDAHTGTLSLIHIGRSFPMTQFPLTSSLSIYLEVEGIERPTTISVQLFDSKDRECGACSFVADTQSARQGSGLVDVLDFTVQAPGEYRLCVCHDGGECMREQSIWFTHESNKSANRN